MVFWICKSNYRDEELVIFNTLSSVNNVYYVILRLKLQMAISEYGNFRLTGITVVPWYKDLWEQTLKVKRNRLFIEQCLESKVFSQPEREYLRTWWYIFPPNETVMATPHKDHTRGTHSTLTGGCSDGADGGLPDSG